jgi:hypothetical protein
MVGIYLVIESTDSRLMCCWVDGRHLVLLSIVSYLPRDLDDREPLEQRTPLITAVGGRGCIKTTICEYRR